MYVFGHVGLTVAAARAVDRDTDLRWAALLALAPDLLDKPGSLLWPALVHRNTRGLGHTFLFSLIVLAAILIWKRRPKTALVLWACYTGHFLLDSMWRSDNPVILLWPLLGHFPPPARGPLGGALGASYILGEIAGLAILVTLARRHSLFTRQGIAAFLKSGRLA